MPSEPQPFPNALHTFLPVATVLTVLLLILYAAAIPMNAVVAETRIAAAGGGNSNARY